MKHRKTSWRNFLKNSSLGVIGTGIIGNKQFGASHKQDEDHDLEMPVIKEYRTLGRTGFKVSDLSSGAT